MLTQGEGLALIIGYGLILTAVVFFTRGHDRSIEEFLVVKRRLGVFRGAFSIAAAWIWAPAVFVCSLKSYTQGLPGIFWFTAPNILCFFTFAPLAIRLRKIFPHGYTWPDFIHYRFQGNLGAQITSLLVYFGYQLGAIIINCVAGGTLLHILTGVDIHLTIVLMSLTALVYSLISGLRASVMTDVIQMILILFIAIVIVPWVIHAAGGLGVLRSGLGGASGNFRNVFDPGVAFSFGIATTFGLISGPIGDQVFFQRTFAARPNALLRIFVVGGLVFGIVPIVLSLLGFVGAAPSVQAQLTVTDPQMIGPIVVAHFLPKIALMAFCVLAFAGLSSTLDSTYCAVSSLGSIDVFRRYIKPDATNGETLLVARATMVIFAVIGTGIGLLQPQLLWVFLVYGALASAALFPTVFSLFSERLTAQGVSWALGLSILLGTPLSLYANVTQNTNLIVLAAVLSVAIGLVVCVFDILRSKKRFAFSSSPLAHADTLEASE
jgi:Na+/proline symporter